MRSRLRERSGDLGKLHLEADHEPRLEAVDVCDQQLVPGDVGSSLVAEQVGLPVRSGDVPVSAIADYRVGMSLGDPLRRAEVYGGSLFLGGADDAPPRVGGQTEGGGDR